MSKEEIIKFRKFADVCLAMAVKCAGVPLQGADIAGAWLRAADDWLFLAHVTERVGSVTASGSATRTEVADGATDLKRVNKPEDDDPSNFGADRAPANGLTHQV